MVGTNIVLTAAHCLDASADELAVRIRPYHLKNPAAESSIFPVRRIALHPEYDPDTLHHDVGMIELDTSLGGIDVADQHSSTPIINRYDGIPIVGQSVLQMGWGDSSNGLGEYTDVLQVVEGRTIADDVCAERVRGTRNEMVCTVEGQNEGICYGDSGETSQ